VGFFLGLMMGTAAFIRAITWDPSHPLLAIAVGTAAVAIVFWANCLGSLLPIIAARLRIDPAIVSGPFMATMVDATGLYIYFRIAKLILGI
jgi:magnesium transporter